MRCVLIPLPFLADSHTHILVITTRIYIVELRPSGQLSRARVRHKTGGLLRGDTGEVRRRVRRHPPTGHPPGRGVAIVAPSPPSRGGRGRRGWGSRRRRLVRVGLRRRVQSADGSARANVQGGEEQDEIAHGGEGVFGQVPCGILAHIRPYRRYAGFESREEELHTGTGLY